MTYISVEFTEEELKRLSDRMDDGESVEHAIHGITLMVLDDLDAQEKMDQEFGR